MHSVATVLSLFNPVLFGLVSSRLLGKPFLCAPLPAKTEARLETTDVVPRLMEDLPQLLLQIVVTVTLGEMENVTIVSTAVTLLVLANALAGHCVGHSVKKHLRTHTDQVELEMVEVEGEPELYTNVKIRRSTSDVPEADDVARSLQTMAEEVARCNPLDTDLLMHTVTKLYVLQQLHSRAAPPAGIPAAQPDSASTDREPADYITVDPEDPSGAPYHGSDAGLRAWSHQFWSGGWTGRHPARPKPAAHRSILNG